MTAAEQTPAADPRPGFATTRAAAEFLAVSSSTMRKWRMTGKGPTFVKFSGRCHYRWQDLERWAAAQAPRRHTGS